MAADFTSISPDGVEIGCRVTGAGAALLMVHGAATDHLCFERIVPTLANHLTLYQMDRRGRGMSGDGADWSPFLEFADVAAVVDAIADAVGGPVNLFGHSLGGLCSLEAAALTDNIARLLVYDPIVIGLEPDDRRSIVEEMVTAVEAGDYERAIEIHLGKWLGLSDGAVERQRRDPNRWARRVALAPTMAREYTAETRFTPDANRISGISVPLRVLIGEQSAKGLQTSAVWVKEHLPHAEVVRLDGHGHYAFNGDPTMFAAKMIEFFDG